MLEGETHGRADEGDSWRRLEGWILEDNEIHLTCFSTAYVDVRHRHTDIVSRVGRILYRKYLA